MRIKVTICNYSHHFSNSLPKDSRIQEEEIKSTLSNFLRPEIILYNGVNPLLQQCAEALPRRPNTRTRSFMGSRNPRFCYQLEEETYTKLSLFLLPFARIFSLIFCVLIGYTTETLYRQLNFLIFFRLFL